MVELTDDYPNGLSDENLLAKIQEFSSLGSGFGKRSPTFQERGYYLQMAQVGQSEYTSRIQVRFADETKSLKAEISELRKSNQKFSRKATRLSRVTIGFAIGMILLAGTTVWYSQRDMESDQIWRDDQMTELKKNNEFLQEQIRINEELNGNILRLLELQDRSGEIESE